MTTLEVIPRTFNYLKNYGAGLNEISNDFIDTKESYEVIVLLKPKDV